jgi:nucleoid DNA-binding protein
LGNFPLGLFPKKNQCGEFQMASRPAAKNAAAKGRKPATKPNTNAARKAAQLVVMAENVQTQVNPMPQDTEDGSAKVVSQMKVKDLIERVAVATDMNRKDVRVIVDAVLVELGKALDLNESMNLPPFGRVRIANQKSDDSGQMMTLKLRRGGAKNSAKEALAEPSEES